jgi:hypothetical protein
MMQEGTQYTYSRRRVLFVNALNQKSWVRTQKRSFLRWTAQRTLRLRDTKNRLRHRTRTV